MSAWRGNGDGGDRSRGGGGTHVGSGSWEGRPSGGGEGAGEREQGRWSGWGDGRWSEWEGGSGGPWDAPMRDAMRNALAAPAALEGAVAHVQGDGAPAGRAADDAKGKGKGAVAHVQGEGALTGRGDAAVADAAGHDQGEGGPRVPGVFFVNRGAYKLEYFENYVARWHGNYKQHNAALKYLRDECENAADPLNSRCLVFDSAVAEQIPRIIKLKVSGRAQDNRDWDWDRREFVPWSWLQLVAQMDAPTMQRVVCGPDNDRSRGLVRCEFRPCPESYDHQRHTKGVARGQAQAVRLPVWDFVLIRDDGTGIRVHPEWSTAKLTLYEVEPHWGPVQPPRAGLGKSDGRGTFSHYKRLHGIPGSWRFDPTKGAGLQPRWQRV